MAGEFRAWSGIIYGEPASKANSRQLVRIGGKWRIIKSKKARDYVKAVRAQIIALPEDEQLCAPIALTAFVFYASERPDLDISVLLDALQGLIYRNDRAVREMHLHHRIDRANPRSELFLQEITDDS